MTERATRVIAAALWVKWLFVAAAMIIAGRVHWFYALAILIFAGVFQALEPQHRNRTGFMASASLTFEDIVKGHMQCGTSRERAIIEASNAQATLATVGAVLTALLCICICAASYGLKLPNITSIWLWFTVVCCSLLLVATASLVVALFLEVRRHSKRGSDDAAKT